MASNEGELNEGELNEESRVFTENHKKMIGK